MTNTVWAFATAEVASRGLFEAIPGEAPKRIENFNSRNMANTVWAFATTGTPGRFVVIADFNPQNMANTLWDFACVGWQQSRVFRELGSAAVERLGALTAPSGDVVRSSRATSISAVCPSDVLPIRLYEPRTKAVAIPDRRVDDPRAGVGMDPYLRTHE